MLLTFLFSWAMAQTTVSNFQYIESEIKRVSEEEPISFDQIAKLFNDEVTLLQTCFKNEDKRNFEELESTELKQTISKLTDENGEFKRVIHVSVVPAKLGFDLVYAVENTTDSPLLKIYDGKMKCELDELSCRNLSFSNDSTLQSLSPSESEKVIEVSEAWTLYPSENERLFGRGSLQVRTQTFTLWGAPKGQMTFDSQFNCVFESVTSEDLNQLVELQ